MLTPRHPSPASRPCLTLCRPGLITRLLSPFTEGSCLHPHMPSACSDLATWHHLDCWKLSSAALSSGSCGATPPPPLASAPSSLSRSMGAPAGRARGSAGLNLAQCLELPSPSPGHLCPTLKAPGRSGGRGHGDSSGSHSQTLPGTAGSYWGWGFSPPTSGSAWKDSREVTYSGTEGKLRPS